MSVSSAPYAPVTVHTVQSVAHGAAPLRGRPNRAANDPAPVPLASGALAAAAEGAGLFVTREALSLLGEAGGPRALAKRGFRGVAAIVGAADGQAHYTVALKHPDPRRTVVLARGTDAAAVAKAWQAWADALSLPLIAQAPDGRVHGELTRFGALVAEAPLARRKGSALVGRRSVLLRRRRNGPRNPTPRHFDEREIIART